MYRVQIVIPPVTSPYNVYYDEEIDNFVFDNMHNSTSVNANELFYVVKRPDIHMITRA